MNLGVLHGNVPDYPHYNPDTLLVDPIYAAVIGGGRSAYVPPEVFGVRTNILRCEPVVNQASSDAGIVDPIRQAYLDGLLPRF